MKNKPQSALPYRIRADLLLQLSALSHASIGPLQALPMIKLPAPYQERMVATLQAVKRGKNLADAGLQSSLWTPLEAGLIQAALAAGDPTPTYRHLAKYYEERAQQIASVKSRMMLPAMMALMSLFISPLPQLVSGALSLGAYLWQALRSILLAVGLIATGIHAYRRFQMRPADAPASVLDQILLALPILGKMHKRRNLCDFWQSMALMLEAGLPMFEALPLGLQAASNVLLRRELARILPLMQAGLSLSDAVRAIPGINDSALLGMIQTGEGSGSLPEMLAHYARAENASLALQQRQVADWIPRIAYALIAAVIAYGIIKSGAFNPHVPADL
ncbi:type II secretion system F family protein [Undibacterium sp. JH2W]|uniref:type II secretion system F family protein n=1 Tax=Undibacterium sp. JH2W TaxID=3413037 RepID=UPI003BF01A78